VAGRALVLGGGGVTGVAWELGLLWGLAEAGVDLTGADLVIGTSAGSVVGAQILGGRPLAELYQAQLAGHGAERPARMGAGVLARLGWAMVRHRDPRRARASIGRMALAARTPTEAQRRAVIEARLATDAWPSRRLVVTAVDAVSGEFVTFDRDGTASLVEAVGASCAVPGVWPPVTIGGRRYIDGGMRSVANADLAVGHDRVVVLAPVMAGFGRIAKQLATLGPGARTTVISPDRAARKAIGRNVLDPARRAPAARAAYAQAAVVRDQVAAVWTATAAA
jgi:NTE family protein